MCGFISPACVESAEAVSGVYVCRCRRFCERSWTWCWCESRLSGPRPRSCCRTRSWSCRGRHPASFLWCATTGTASDSERRLSHFHLLPTMMYFRAIVSFTCTVFDKFVVMLRYHDDMGGFTWEIQLNNNNKLSYCLYFIFFFEDGCCRQINPNIFIYSTFVGHARVFYAGLVFSSVAFSSNILHNPGVFSRGVSPVSHWNVFL